MKYRQAKRRLIVKDNTVKRMVFLTENLALKLEQSITTSMASCTS